MPAGYKLGERDGVFCMYLSTAPDKLRWEYHEQSYKCEPNSVEEKPMALLCRSYASRNCLKKKNFSFPKMTLRNKNVVKDASAPGLGRRPRRRRTQRKLLLMDHNTPPGRLVLGAPIARILDAELMGPPPPPSLPPESGGFEPMPALAPSTALPASFLSINMGFLPSRSKSLKSANGFSSIPTTRSWSP
jgi:hypothetical protein